MPAIPAVKAALGLSESVAQLTFSIALFSMAFATLFYGSLSDRYGRRPVLLSGLCLFLAGSAISAGATSVTVLVLGRLVQAVGAGCGITLVRAIAQDVYGPSRCQGDRLPNDGLHARSDDIADDRRDPRRCPRLAQRVRLRAGGRGRHRTRRVPGGVRNPPTAIGQPDERQYPGKLLDAPLAPTFRRVRFANRILQRIVSPRRHRV